MAILLATPAAAEPPIAPTNSRTQPRDITTKTVVRNPEKNVELGLPSRRQVEIRGSNPCTSHHDETNVRGPPEKASIFGELPRAL